MILSTDQLKVVMWALIEVEPELCVPPEMGAWAEQKLDSMTFDDIEDEEITALFQQIVKEYF